MKPKILIIGSGHTPTGRCRALLDRMLFSGFDASYRKIGDEIVGNKVHQELVDEYPLSLVSLDFSELEVRFGNVLIYGNSHPEMFDIEPMKEPSPDKRKGPKGPRNRWGNI